MNNRTVAGALQLAAMLALCAAAPARAGSAPAGSGSAAGWTYEVTPYAWLAGIKGDTRVGTRLPPVKVDASFSDIADKLDMAFMGIVEARKARWGVLFDLFYIKLSADVEPVSPIRSGNNTAELEQLLLQFAGAYRVLDDGATSVDALFGVRHARLEVDLTLAPGLLRPFGTERSGRVDWTDGFVGARVLHKLSERWSLVGYADMGGGGSDLSWQFIAGADYRFSSKMSGKLGFRKLSMDYPKTRFAYDIQTYGVYAGLGFKF